MVEAVQQLRQVIDASDIKRIAIVDDVFDVPTVPPANLKKYIQENEALQQEAFIPKELWDGALAEINSGGADDPDFVPDLTEKLYNAYIEAGDSKYDPQGAFKASREDNLKFVRPILHFLKSCDIDIDTYGSEEPIVKDGHMPDLVLVDLFLNPNISSQSSSNDATANAAANKSVDRVQKLRDKNPAIILMSSHGEPARQKAEDYRASIKDGVYASRFGFVSKADIKLDAEMNLTIESAASDTLYHIFETSKFGKALSEALNRWINGAKTAVNNIERDIQLLQLKEMAYLVQFRLDAEGQGIEEYLEWFFGEALLDYIIRAADDAPNANSLEQDLDIKAISSVDGSFEPTKAVAKMYHRVRVENKRTRTRKNFRLGDLYLKSKDEVIAVMTPDCDLVLRGAKPKRNAEDLLLVGGKVSNLEKTSASVGDFLMIDDVPHNIDWKYKKISTVPFTDNFSAAGQSIEPYKYLGTLRPLYAQEIQAKLLSHVGRVGVAVPPVIGLSATATIVVRSKNGAKAVSFEGATATFGCSLIPARASDFKDKVLFGREVIRKITQVLMNVDADPEIQGAADNATQLKEANAKDITDSLTSAPELKSDLGYGVKLVYDENGKYSNKSEAPWLAIYIKSAAIDDLNSAVKPEAGQAQPESQESNKLLTKDSDTIVVNLPVEAIQVNQNAPDNPAVVNENAGADGSPKAVVAELDEGSPEK